ncbi:hypothetical protein [Nevskia ramosa]|uniref:hypothetical protein n=1 Tax=Nevskia ramosa TaxID=64002 RepID=UPI0003B3F3E9|nr:hypothetical protein [Nevskia ramosa]
MNAFKKRVFQPSTWAGLAAIFAALAPLFGIAPDVVHGATAALGGVAVVMNEHAG